MGTTELGTKIQDTYHLVAPRSQTHDSCEHNVGDLYFCSEYEKEKLNHTLPIQCNIISSNGLVSLNKKERTGWKRYLGMLLALGSCLSFSLCIVIVKFLSHKIHPASFGVYRFTGILLSLPILLYYRFSVKVNIFQTVWPLSFKHKDNLKTGIVLILRGICGCTAILLQYYAVGFISIATCTTITFSTPIFVGLFAWIFLGEKCGVLPVISALITFLGVVITVGFVPGATGEFALENENIVGTSLALGSMFFGMTVFIMLRYLRRVHFTLVTTSFGFIGLIESSIVCAVINQFDVPDSAWEWFLVIAVGLLTLLSQTLMTCAFKFEDAGPLALVRTTDVIFAFIWQFIFFSKIPDVYSSVGAVVVCVGVGLTAFRKYITTLAADHSNRKRWAFMLK